MPGSTGPNLELVWGYDIGESGWGVGGFNPNFARLDTLVQLAVLSVEDDPPGAPTNGDRYIVGGSPTGVWVGHEDDVAVYLTTGVPGWLYLIPKAGHVAFNVDTGDFVYFDGAVWGLVPAGAGGTGDVVGPASAVAGNIAVFIDATHIDDSGASLVDLIAGLGLGSVTQVNTGTGLTGGPITTIGTIDLDDTAVTPGTYVNPTFTVDQQGRLTAAVSGSSGLTTETHTTDYTVLVGDTGKHFNISGAGGDVTFSLPPAAVDLNFGLLVSAAHYAKFLADGTDVISRAADDSDPGGYIRSNVSKSFLKIECHEAGNWIVSSEIGAWGVDV